MILDTNALSAFADGDAGVGDALRTQPRAAIPVIVLGEFRYGIARLFSISFPRKSYPMSAMSITGALRSARSRVICSALVISVSVCLTPYLFSMAAKMFSRFTQSSDIP